MKVCQGKSVFAGVAMGPLFVYKRAEKAVEKYQITDPEAEIARYEAAKAKAAKQLRLLEEKTRQEIGEEEARIFETHGLLLEDLDFVEGILEMIREDHVNAEYAVFVTSEQCAAVFHSMDDAYMRARAADVGDIARRLISILNGSQIGTEAMPGPVILVADDLAPSETVQFEKGKILALVTRKGSANSHTAILARTMQIPCLVATEMELTASLSGKTGAVDGFTGTLYVEPDEAVRNVILEKERREQERQKRLKSLRGLPTVTKSGRKVQLFANMGSLEDVEEALLQDPEGIGLFRSEFLYLGRKEYPSEEEQFQVYRQALLRMEGKKVVIRTLDIGADKQAEYFGIPKEENPAMGFRAIRICLNRKDVFCTQLRAIYRAAAYGKAAMMLPMIISVEEILQVKALIKEVQEGLRQQGIPFGEVELGIMVETPAAVIIADLLAKEVDFFSIGTNDLTQYTLAMDRQNQALEAIYDPHHEAVLRMVGHTIGCAHEAGIWCGICGELAADLSLTERFVEMGVDELSVSPGFILELREKIREMDGPAA